MTTTQILFSKPQFVSLIRLVMMLCAFIMFSSVPLISISLVIISELLDALDGYLARKEDKVSDFGAIADLLIDRLTPVFCLTMLITLAPAWVAILSLILAIDLLGHMAMLYSALLTPNISHHKKIFIGANKLLTLYYAENGFKRSFMVLNIIFYNLAMLAWILYFLLPHFLSLSTVILLTILGSFKFYIHLLHIYYSFKITLGSHPASFK